MRPADADSGRAQHFWATLRRPAVVSAIVVGASAALVLGAATASPAVALAAPAVVLAGVVAWAWRAAERAAELCARSSSRAWTSPRPTSCS
jgi:serine acetyltransferase